MKHLNLPHDQHVILETLVNKIKKDYDEHIDGVVCYGSYITQTSHRLSDLDFFYIPRDKMITNMSFQFIYNDIGYDFFPISWQRLSRFANFEEDLTSLIISGKLVYARDEKVEEKFSQLKIKASKPGDYELKQGVERHLKESKALFFDMYQESIDHTPRIINHLVTAVAYINKTHIFKSVSQLEQEVSRFKLKPMDFLNRLDHIISNPYLVIHNDLQKLIVEVSHMADKSVETHLEGLYEELKSTYNKVYVACEAEDFIKVYFTLSNLCFEIRSAFGDHYHKYDFPDLSREIRTKNFKRIMKLTKIHEDMCCFALSNMGIQLNAYDDMNELKNRIDDL